LQTAFEQDPDPYFDPAGKLSAKLYDLYHYCVYNEETPYDGQRNCPKHVEFHSKNKFEKLVHLVGLLSKSYHYARSHERQKRRVIGDHGSGSEL
jgi:hypothetical protein